MMTSLLKKTVSTFALLFALNAPLAASYSDEEASPKGRYSVGKDWDDGKSVASRAFSDRRGPALKKPSKEEELSYGPEDEWEVVSQYTARSEGMGKESQKLSEIVELRRYMNKGHLEVTPKTYEALLKFSNFYTTSFLKHDKGLTVKGWQASLGFDELLDLLQKFSNIKTFRLNIIWNQEADITDLLTRTLQFYENLTELDISGCRITDEGMNEVMEAIQNPSALGLLDIRNNPLTADAVKNIKNHFSHLASLKSDINTPQESNLDKPLSSLKISSLQDKEAEEKAKEARLRGEIEKQLRKEAEEREKKAAQEKAERKAEKQRQKEIEEKEKARRESEEQLRKKEEKRATEMKLTIPPIAQGYEAIYERFLKGALIYRPKEGSDEGMIKLPIAQLKNPLEGTFDLSQCGDAGKHLSISTGYRKGEKAANAKKLEIWIAPRFLIEKELKTTASHFQVIMSYWPESAPVGIFWILGSWVDLSWVDLLWYDYLTTENMDTLSNNNLYQKWLTADAEPNYRTFPYHRPAVYGIQKFHVAFCELK